MPVLITIVLVHVILPVDSKSLKILNLLVQLFASCNIITVCFACGICFEPRNDYMYNSSNTEACQMNQLLQGR